MKRTFYYFFVLIIIFSFSFVNVEAENDESKTPPDMSTTYIDGEECTFARKDELRATAANVVVSYIPVEVKETIKSELTSGETGELIKHYLDIKIYNVNTKLIIKAKDIELNQEQLLNFYNLGSDGAITIRVPASTEQVRNWEFKIYSYKYNCFTDPIRTIKLTLPMYNINSDLNICDDIPDYYLCRQFVTSQTDSEEFYKYVNAYKEKLEIREQNNESMTVNGINKVVSKIKDYKYFIVIILIVIGIVITTIIVLKQKKGDEW